MSGLLIAALTASTHTPIGRGSEDLGCKHLPFDGSQRSCCWLADAAAMPTGVGLTSMQLPPVATGATACRSRPIATCYARSAGSLGDQDRRAEQRLDRRRPWS